MKVFVVESSRSFKAVGTGCYPLVVKKNAVACVLLPTKTVASQGQAPRAATEKLEKRWCFPGAPATPQRSSTVTVPKNQIAASSTHNTSI